MLAASHPMLGTATGSISADPMPLLQILDAAWTKLEPAAERAPVRKAAAKTKKKIALSQAARDEADESSDAVKASMASLSAAGLLSPPLPNLLGLSLSKPMRAGLRELRDLFVCVRSEARRSFPAWCCSHLNADSRHPLRDCFPMDAPAARRRM